MISRRHLFWLMLAGGLSLQQTAAFAEDGGSDGGDGGGDDGGGDGGTGTGGDKSVDGDGDGDDQRRALDAVKNNKAASLKEILAIVREKYTGEIVSVALQGSGSSLVYLLKVLDTDSRLIEIQIDAKSRKIIGTKGT